MKYRILNTIGEKFDTEAKITLNSLGEVDYLMLSQTELEQKIGGYDIVFCGLGLVFSVDVFAKASKLKILVTATTGLDHIDLVDADKRGIKVLSLKGEDDFLDTITGTAELALGLMLSLVRNIPQAHVSVMAGVWNREQFRGHTLRGKTLGIVGMGRLGKMVARYGNALGMKILFVDPYVNQDIFPSYKKCSKDELIQSSDIISIHTHLTLETVNLIDSVTLSKIKHGSCIINTSRGKIVDESAIINALEKGRLSGYASDVLADELEQGGDVSTSKLVVYARTHANVVMTPHIGGMTYESRKDTDIFMANKLKAYLDTIPLMHT